MSSASSPGFAARTREWLALSATPGLGPTRIKRLLEHFGDVARVFRASLTELEAAGIPAVAAQAIAGGKSTGRPPKGSFFARRQRGIRRDRHLGRGCLIRRAPARNLRSRPPTLYVRDAG